MVRRLGREIVSWRHVVCKDLLQAAYFLHWAASGNILVEFHNPNNVQRFRNEYVEWFYGTASKKVKIQDKSEEF